MSNRLLRVVSGSLIVICGVAPGSATVVKGATSVHPANLSQTQTALRRKSPRFVRLPGSDKIQQVTRPLGCSQNGPSSFVGETGNGSNFAGGTFYNGVGAAFSGVVAGDSNFSCDSNTGILAGFSNIIGGDNTTLTSTIGGGADNEIEGSIGAFIAAGQNNMLSNSPGIYSNGNNSAIVAGTANIVTSPGSFIGAGAENDILGTTTSTNGQSAFIGAGVLNGVFSNFASVVGGQSNLVSGDFSSIVGGMSNLANSQYAIVSGGLSNQIQTGGQYGAIGGGYGNIVSGVQATVGGGYGNLASGRNAAIPGGAYNIAGGLDSLAAGNTSHATYDGTFVWSDYSASKGITSTAANQFLARAAGGFYLYSSASLKSGVKLAPGSGSWSSLSDRAAKTGVETVDDAHILAKVVSLPISEWSYTAQGTGIRHLGPMAQDFRAAFGLGEDDRHVTAIDEEGVALAAIKGLQAEVAEKDRQLDDIRRTDDARFARLEQRLEALEGSSQTMRAHAGSR